MLKSMVEGTVAKVQVLVRIKPTRIIAEKDIAGWD